MMSMEWARATRVPGFVASWPQFGVPCGLFLANLRGARIQSRMSAEQSWPGAGVSRSHLVSLCRRRLYIRLGILETLYSPGCWRSRDRVHPS